MLAGTEREEAEEAGYRRAVRRQMRSDSNRAVGGVHAVLVVETTDRAAVKPMLGGA